MSESEPTRPASLPPRFDPKEFEERLYREWESSGAFAPTGKGEKTYTIVIPPPNVTGRLHVGHALVNTLQDALVRWRRMQGYDTLWLPGTDHAGISTQMVVERELQKNGQSRLGLGREKFEARVWEWKQEYGNAITMQLRRLGVSCDWSRERFTLDPALSRAVRRVFVSLYEKGLIYRDRYIVNWCPRCSTAISDLEVEYHDSNGKLWTLRYPAADGKGEVCVATTRPETMLGDTGVSVHPDDERYRALVGREVILPIVGRRIPVVADSFVDPKFGTGAVKVTPAHDANDFACGRRHGLAEVVVIGADGKMTAEAGPDYAGLDRFEARKKVVAKLEELGALVKVEPYQNAVGRCAKCDTVVEPYLSWQWFVKIGPLAKPAIDAVESGRTEILPKSWEKTYFEWMKNIHDWCISRQLWWGHRIPAWFCSCGEIVVKEEAPASCPKCGGTELRQDDDVLDTWFSSGLWAFSTFGWPDRTEDLRRHYPTDVLVTGFDILFFWVARMMMLSLEFMGDVPFRKVFLHGLVRDEKGHKMSKTRGNIVDPLDIIDEFGADAVRFTLAVLSGTGRDIPFSKTRLAGYRAFATKIWNAARFALGFLEGLDRMPELPQTETLATDDRWILAELDLTAKGVDRSLEEFRFDEAAQAIYDFVWRDLCDWYLETSKPVLSGKKGTDAEREAKRAVLAHCLDSALRMLHPFMPFVTEEIWRRLPGNDGKMLLVAPFPRSTGFVDEEACASFGRFQQVVGRVRNLRIEQKIAPAVPLELRFPSAEAEAAMAPFLDLFPILAKCEARGGEPEAGARAVRDRIPGVEFVLVLPPAEIDPKEQQKLEKELETISAEIDSCGGKLSNPEFTSKAPAAVVEKTRARIAELTKRQAAIRANLESHGGKS
jgi:valyl-tRNA synthetase